ncbi:MAG: P-II family nitrogen regulator [Bacilli bacterium]|jgi:nitrogen regulatory protein PII
MKLLIFILTKTEKLDTLAKELAKHEFTGATVIKSWGIARRILQSNDETLSNIVGSLRKILNPENVPNNTVFMVVKDEKIPEAINVIESVVGSLDEPDNGLVFTLPVDFVKGMKH